MKLPAIKPRHKAIAKELKRQLETNEHTPIYQVLETYGNYPASTSRHMPNRIMKTKAMQQALKEVGLDVKEADTVLKGIVFTPVVSEMITPDNQLRAIDMIYKRMGAYAPEKLEVRKVIAKITFNKPI